MKGLCLADTLLCDIGLFLVNQSCIATRCRGDEFLGL